MHRADNIGTALLHASEIVLGRHDDPPARRDFVEMKEFREGSAEVAPHLAREGFALARGLLGIGGLEMGERPGVTLEMRRERGPQRGREVRGDFEGKGGKERGD